MLGGRSAINVDEVAALLLPIALPVGLAVALLVLIWIVVAALEEGGWSGRPTPGVARLVHWAPRLGMLAYAGFASVLAVDVLGEDYQPSELVRALLEHLIPAFVVLAVTALAWRWPLLGAAALVGWSSWYLAVTWGRFEPDVYADLAGIPFLLGVLFLLDSRYRVPHEAAPAPPRRRPAR